MRSSDSTYNRLVRVVSLLTPVLAVAMLLGIYSEQQVRAVDPSEVEAYHQRAAAEAEKLPMNLAGWEGRESPVPDAAVSLLRPNFILSRRYHNPETGQSASVLIVHCKDSRDLVGHYPPNCYVNSGWTLGNREPIDLRAKNQGLPSIMYQFNRDTLRGVAALQIANFMILPDGRIVRDMPAVREFAQDRFKRQYGAAQLQVVMNGDLRPEEASDLAERLIALHRPVIDAIQSGVKP